MADTKTFPMVAVRKVIGDEAQRQFGAMTGVQLVFQTDSFRITIPAEEYFDRVEVTVSLRSDIYAEQVESYYINFPSRWSSAEYAEKLSVLLGGAAMIGKALEKLWVPYIH